MLWYGIVYVWLVYSKISGLPPGKKELSPVIERRNNFFKLQEGNKKKLEMRKVGNILAVLILAVCGFPADA